MSACPLFVSGGVPYPTYRADRQSNESDPFDIYRSIKSPLAS